jgi:hypothetical protein
VRLRPLWVSLTALVLLSCRDHGPGASAPVTDPPGSGAPGGSPGEPTPACQRVTCEELGAQCGLFNDGCDGLLHCTSCPAGTTCGTSGFGPICMLPLDVHAPAWLWRSPSGKDDQLGGVASDAEGNALVLWYSGADDAVALDRAPGPEGTPVRRFPWTGTIRNVFRSTPNLHRGPRGELYVGVTGFVGFGDVAYVDLGAGPRTGAQTVELRRDGGFVRTALSCCDLFFEATEWLEDVDGGGNLLVGFWSTGKSGTRLLRGDGREILLHSYDNVTGAEEGTRCDSPRFTPDGNLVCAGVEDVSKRDLDGRVVWRTPLSRDGFAVLPTQVGVTARGTIVVAGRVGVRVSRGVYAALEPDGAVRFVRDVAPAPGALAVSPAGRAALLLSDAITEGGPSEVLYANLAGDLLWRAPLPGGTGAKRIAFAGDRVVVAGTVAAGWQNLGTGPFQAESADVFVMAFDP